MMSFYTTTALTALVGAVGSMVIGLVWYGPLFGKKWAEIIGFKMPSKEEAKAMQKQMMPLYLLNFLASFIMFFGLGFFAAFIGRLTIPGSLIYAVFIWAAFVMPVEAGAAIWSGKSRKHSFQMFLLTAGYQLINLLVGALLWAAIYPHFM